MHHACFRPLNFKYFYQHSACHSASCNFPLSRPQPCRPMCFSFSVVMVKSEPEVLANKGETCYHCRLRHHDHGHRQHRRRAHSRSVSRHRHRRARSPRRRRRSRTPADAKDVRNKRDPVPRRAIGTQPRLFHRIHTRSSLKGQRMFNRSSDHQCRAAKRPSLTRANRLCH